MAEPRSKRTRHQHTAVRKQRAKRKFAFLKEVGGDVIGPGENVYVIPQDKGEEMLWQALAGFRFSLAQGYIGPLPADLDTGRMAEGLHIRKVPDPPKS